jgi:ribosomal protein S18 acetylase RimI-like enzyme
MKLIKAAGITDMPIIHNLAHEIWPSAYGDILSPAQLKYMLNQFYSLSSLQKQVTELKHHFILILDENIPVGFASFSLKEKDSSIFRLHKIYVLPQQQGTATGKLLLEYVINSAKLSGATSLELNVNRHNKARSFYEKYGFTITGQEDIDIGAGYFMNDYVMKLALK